MQRDKVNSLTFIFASLIILSNSQIYFFVEGVSYNINPRDQKKKKKKKGKIF